METNTLSLMSLPNIIIPSTIGMGSDDVVNIFQSPNTVIVPSDDPHNYTFLTEHNNNARFPVPNMSYDDVIDLETLVKARKEMYERTFSDSITFKTENASSNIEITNYMNEITKGKQMYLFQAKLFLEHVKILDEIKIVQAQLTSYFRDQLSSLSLIKNKQHLFQVSQQAITNYIDATESFKQHVLDSLSEAFDNAKRNCDETESIINSMKPLYVAVQMANSFRACSICLNKEVDSYFVPCGHTFCSQCIKKNNGDCFICRKKVLTVNSLFYS
jgi:hypothetical protein